MGINFQSYALQAPSDMLAGIVQIITNESIFIPLLGFETTTEFSKTYNQQKTLGGISFRGLNQYYTPDVGVLAPAAEVLKVFGGTVDTDRQLAKGANGRKVRANNVAGKMKKAALFFDRQVIKGDSTADPNQFDGLNRRLVNNQLIAAGTNGATLTLKLLDKLLTAVVGANANKVLVMNLATRDFIKQLILASAGGAAVGDFVSGELNAYNGAKILLLDEGGDETPILDLNETQGTNNATVSIYCIRAGSLDGEMMRGLVRQAEGSDPIEYVDYGERNGVYQELVETVMSIALYHPRCAARLKGVLLS